MQDTTNIFVNFEWKKHYPMKGRPVSFGAWIFPRTGGSPTQFLCLRAGGELCQAAEQQGPRGEYEAWGHVVAGCIEANVVDTPWK